MGRTAITLRILREGRRTDELLAHVERRFGAERLQRDEFGAVRISVTGRAAVAWDHLREALDASGADWRERVYLAPRPFGRGSDSRLLR